MKNYHNLSQEEKKQIKKARDDTSTLGISVSDNIVFLCHALEITKDLEGCYLECGVYKGSTILTAEKFSRLRKINRKFIGVDSFKGFPECQTTNVNDKPEKFEEMFKAGKITLEHFNASKERLSKIKNITHLETVYFNEPGKIIFEESKRRNIELLVGSFSEILPDLNLPICILHIDCDLYEPYLECLRLQFKNIVKGGIIVLDEYYSLKYPGARIAVNEFLSTLNKTEYDLEMFKTTNFERWFIVKK